MPKWLHSRLERQADKQGLTGDSRGAYIHGTLNKYEQKHAGDMSLIKLASQSADPDLQAFETAVDKCAAATGCERELVKWASLDASIHPAELEYTAGLSRNCFRAVLKKADAHFGAHGAMPGTWEKSAGGLATVIPKIIGGAGAAGGKAQKLLGGAGGAAKPGLYSKLKSFLSEYGGAAAIPALAAGGAGLGAATSGRGGDAGAGASAAGAAASGGGAPAAAPGAAAPTPGPAAVTPKPAGGEAAGSGSITDKIKNMHPGMLAALGIGVPLAGYGAYRAMGGGDEEEKSASDTARQKLYKNASAALVAYLDTVLVKTSVDKRAHTQGIQKALSSGLNLEASVKQACPTLNKTAREDLISKLIDNSAAWIRKQSNAQMGYNASSAMSSPSGLGGGNSASASMPASQGVGAMKSNMGY